MGLVLFLGCVLIALGPPSVIFTMAVAPQAHLVVLMVLSGFFWICSLSLTSLAWILVEPLQSNPVASLLLAVLLQELARYGYYLLCLAAERRVAAITTQKLFCPNSFDSILASGLGFGTANVLVSFGKGLEESVGNGTIYLPSCTSMSYYFSSSLVYSLTLFHNIFLMVIATDGFKRKHRETVLGAIGLHLAASLATTLNESKDGCTMSIPLLFVVVVLSAIWAARIVWAGLDYTNGANRSR